MNTLKSYSIAALISCSTITLMACAVSCTHSQYPQEVVIAYRDAVNSHLTDSVMSFYTSDAVFEIPALNTFLQGTEELRGLTCYDSVLHSHLEIDSIRVYGDTAFCSVLETNDWLTAAGVGSAYFPNVTFILENRRISFINAALSDSSGQQLKTVLSSFLPWVHVKYSTEFAGVAPNGQFLYNAKSAQMMVAFLKEWRATQN
jgi:hypothetical protein